jgi:hypothetical protein
MQTRSFRGSGEPARVNASSNARFEYRVAGSGQPTGAWEVGWRALLSAAWSPRLQYHRRLFRFDFVPQQI